MIVNRLIKFKNFFKNKNKWVVIGLMFSFDFVLSSVLVSLFRYFTDEDIFTIDYLLGESLLIIFFLTVVFSPIVETLIFQFIVIEVVLYVFNKFKWKNSILISIGISGLAFGLSHSYNIYYIIVTFIIGVLYAFYYVVAKNIRSLNPFWTVTFLHTLSNLSVFIMVDLLGLM